MDWERGGQIGPYALISCIGAGGMGAVWKALDTRLHRVVAVKKTNGQHSERFDQEARSIAALNLDCARSTSMGFASTARTEYPESR